MIHYITDSDAPIYLSLEDAMRGKSLGERFCELIKQALAYRYLRMAYSDKFPEYMNMFLGNLTHEIKRVLKEASLVREQTPEYIIGARLLKDIAYNLNNTESTVEEVDAYIQNFGQAIPHPLIKNSNYSILNYIGKNRADEFDFTFYGFSLGFNKVLNLYMKPYLEAEYLSPKTEKNLSEKQDLLHLISGLKSEGGSLARRFTPLCIVTGVKEKYLDRSESLPSLCHNVLFGGKPTKIYSIEDAHRIAAAIMSLPLSKHDATFLYTVVVPIIASLCTNRDEDEEYIRDILRWAMQGHELIQRDYDMLSTLGLGEFGVYLMQKNTEFAQEDFGDSNSDDLDDDEQDVEDEDTDDPDEGESADNDEDDDGDSDDDPDDDNEDDDDDPSSDEDEDSDDDGSDDGSDDPSSEDNEASDDADEKDPNEIDFEISTDSSMSDLMHRQYLSDVLTDRIANSKDEFTIWLSRFIKDNLLYVLSIDALREMMSIEI